ncbi:MAG: hypothetical protein IPG28_11290 [Betaproteobacteria bacterium]|nr:hypothetical protein [Betaproteobacteria bacterium]
MNHLFLWVGSRSDTEQAGHTLLMPYKSDGARPAFGAMEKLPAILPIENLAKLIREHIDGVSSVLPFDNESNEPAVACDLLGTFHLHLRRLSDGIAVRNSGAILAGLKPSSNLDALGVQESCSNAAANEDPTIWQEVRKLRSGRILAQHFLHSPGTYRSSPAACSPE